MSTDQPAPAPDEPESVEDTSTDPDSDPDPDADGSDSGGGGPPVDVAHQAEFQFDGGDDDDDPEEVISTEGVVTETTLGDYGADVSDARKRETKLDRAEASEFGVDDRPTSDNCDGGDQETLVSDVDDGQQTITGEEATGQFMFGGEQEPAEAQASSSGTGDDDSSPDVGGAGDKNGEDTDNSESESESNSNSDSKTGGDGDGDGDSGGDDNGDDAGATPIHGVGAGRRRTLAAIDEKPPLEPVEAPDSIQDLVDALEAIALESYSSPPTEVIDTLESVYEGLPEDAQPHFVDDEILLRRINAARNQFNDYLGKLKRMKEMPSPVEAGPANYPAKKARKRSKYAREGSEELDERLSNVASGARGARQRALEAIGSSVAERNEQQRDERRESKRATLEAGDLVRFRNPRLHIGEVIRVNQKSIRVRYPNPRAGGTKPMSDEPEPDFRETRVDLDSGSLAPLAPEDLDEFGVDAETLEGTRETLFEA